METITTKTATAKDVHNEFDRVSKHLYDEAFKIINNKNKSEKELSYKMKELGFGNSVSIKEDENIIKNAQSIFSSSILYPQNNFFTEESIEKICKKYGLLLARPNDYIGEIPVKNQMEITNFKLAESHQKVIVIDRKKFAESIVRLKGIKNKKNDNFNFWTFISDVMQYAEISALKRKYTRTMSKKTFLSENDPNISFRSEVKPEFMIVATPDNFNLTNKEIVGEYKLVDKDPVVLCKIGGLYCQVSCWGEEVNHNEFKTATKN